MPVITIRPAMRSDAPAMLAIYAPYVTDTTVSSEYIAPTLAEFCHRMESITAYLPWLVCCADGVPIGYGYASPHRTRAGYQWSAETSIYVAQGWHRHGVASALYRSIFEILTAQGYYNIFVGITSPNETSVHFHTALGFVFSGVYQKSMYKFGQWRDVTWMAKRLREQQGEPAPTVAFDTLFHRMDGVLAAQAATVRL